MKLAFKQFLAEKELVCTPKTVAGYRSAIGLFVDYADVPLSSEKVKWAVVEYLSTKRSTVSDYSLHTYWRTLRVFCRWLAAEGLIGPITLPVVKAPQNVIRPYSLDRIRKTIERQDNTFLGLRAAAMVRLVFDTGIRLGEIPTIERAGTDLQKRLLVVYGKGRKERWITSPFLPAFYFLETFGLEVLLQPRLRFPIQVMPLFLSVVLARRVPSSV
jgi:site-specific recombinase XerC